MKTVRLNLKHMDIAIDIPDGVVADPKLLDGGHPLYYAVKNKKQTEDYLNCVYDLLKDLPKGMSVLEYCGGIGLIARSLWLQLQPRSWEAVELDKSCEPLFATFNPPGLVFYNEDMYTPRVIDHDLVICEFSNNTIPKMWREHKRAALLNRIANARPKYWYIADVGYYWIHLANHWPIYQARFNTQVTRGNYHKLFDEFMREMYGYQLVKHTIGGGAGYYLFSPVEVSL